MSKNKSTKSQRRDLNKERGKDQVKKGIGQVVQAGNPIEATKTIIGSTVEGAIYGAATKGNAKVGAGLGLVKGVAKAAGQSAGNVAKGVGNIIIGGLKAATGINDLEWYNNVPSMVSEMTGPNFNYKKNTPIGDWGKIGQTHAGVPSILGLEVFNTIGPNHYGLRRTALDRIYTGLRQTTTGTPEYANSSIEAYLINYRTAVIGYTAACRILRVLNTFNALDNDAPYQYLLAMGVNPDQFRTNAANFRQRLIQIRYQLETVGVVSLDIFKRSEWLYTGMFADSDDAKASLYCFVPRAAYKFNLGEGAMTSKALCFGNAGNPIGYTTFMDNLSEAVQGVTALSANYLRLAGDMVRAYSDRLYKLPPVPGDTEYIGATYSEEVLTQIQNATIMPGLVGENAVVNHYWNIVSDGANNAWKEEFNTNITGAASLLLPQCSKAPINMYKDNITKLDVMGATRFTATYTAEYDAVTNTMYARPTSYGTEIITCAVLWGRLYDDATGESTRFVRRMYGWEGHILSGDADSQAAQLEAVQFLDSVWANFDWMARMRHSIILDNGGTTDGNYLYDFNNYAVFDNADQLQAIHDIAISSLLFAPIIAKQITGIVKI